MLTFEELLAGILLEQRLVRHWCLEVVDHKVKDRSDVFLTVPSELGERRVLDVVSLIPITTTFELTHGPRSIIMRARYIAAAAV